MIAPETCVVDVKDDEFKDVIARTSSKKIPISNPGLQFSVSWLFCLFLVISIFFWIWWSYLNVFGPNVDVSNEKDSERVNIILACASILFLLGNLIPGILLVVASCCSRRLLPLVGSLQDVYVISGTSTLGLVLINRCLYPRCIQETFRSFLICRISRTPISEYFIPTDQLVAVIVSPFVFQHFCKTTRSWSFAIAWVISFASICIAAAIVSDFETYTGALIVVYFVIFGIALVGNNKSDAPFLATLSDRAIGSSWKGITKDKAGQAAMLRQIIANLSHDLLTPIQALEVGFETLQSVISDVIFRLSDEEKTTYQYSDIPRSFTLNDGSLAKNQGGGVGGGGSYHPTLNTSKDALFDELFQKSSESNSSNIDIVNMGVGADMLDLIQSMRCTLTFLSLIIARILDVSKATAGIALTPRIEYFNFIDCIKNTVSIVEQMDKRFKFEIVISESIRKHLNGSLIYTDKRWFEGDTFCMLSNAVKYSRNYALPIKIVVSIREPKIGRRNNSLMFCLEIVDSGLDMSEEERKKLFRAPEQAERLELGGSGLGLFAVKQHANTLGGYAGSNNRDDGLSSGSSFWIMIPFKKERETQATGSTASSSASVRVFSQSVLAIFQKSEMMGMFSDPIPEERDMASIEANIGGISGSGVGGIGVIGGGIHDSGNGGEDGGDGGDGDCSSNEDNDLLAESPQQLAKRRIDFLTRQLSASAGLLPPIRGNLNQHDVSEEKTCHASAANINPSRKAVNDPDGVRDFNSTPKHADADQQNPQHQQNTVRPLFGDRVHQEKGEEESSVSRTTKIYPSNLPKQNQPSLFSVSNTIKSSDSVSQFNSSSLAIEHVESVLDLNSVPSPAPPAAAVPSPASSQAMALSHLTPPNSAPLPHGMNSSVAVTTSLAAPHSLASNANETYSFLVVDDSPSILKLTRLNLQRAGHIVDLAEDGLIALNKLKEKKYHVVLMDLQMPVMGGIECVKRFREFEAECIRNSTNNRPFFPGGTAIMIRDEQFIIGMSAQGDERAQRESIASGMNCFMPKPCSIENIMKLIHLHNCPEKILQSLEDEMIFRSIKDLPMEISSTNLKDKNSRRTVIRLENISNEV